MGAVFPRTIVEIDRRIEKLEKEIDFLYEQGKEAYSGGDGWHSAGFRFLEQHRIAQEETLRILRKLKKNVRALEVPCDTEAVSLGHLVTVMYIDPEVVQKFHICSSDDAGLLSGVCETSQERLLSVETELGKRLLGKEQGDSVAVGSKELRVEEIEISYLAEDR